MHSRRAALSSGPPGIDQHGAIAFEIQTIIEPGPPAFDQRRSAMNEQLAAVPGFVRADAHGGSRPSRDIGGLSPLQRLRRGWQTDLGRSVEDEVAQLSRACGHPAEHGGDVRRWGRMGHG